MFSSSALFARPSHFSFSTACLHCEQLAAHLNLAQFHFSHLNGQMSGFYPKWKLLNFGHGDHLWNLRNDCELVLAFQECVAVFQSMKRFSTCFRLFSWLQYYLSKAKCTFLVAEFDSSIVGFIAVDQKSETRATVRRMSVDTCFRGRRKLIATRLLQEAFSFCQDCGYEDLMVEFPGINKTKTHRLRHYEVKPTRQDFFVARQGWTSRKDNYVTILRATWSCDVTRRDHSSKVPWRHWLAT